MKFKWCQVVPIMLLCGFKMGWVSAFDLAVAGIALMYKGSDAWYEKVGVYGGSVLGLDGY